MFISGGREDFHYHAEAKMYTALALQKYVKTDIKMGT